MAAIEAMLGGTRLQASTLKGSMMKIKVPGQSWWQWLMPS
jgi:hypothetical protein